MSESLATLNGVEADTDDLSELVAAIEELISERGPRATVAAALRSSAGEHFQKTGGNQTLRVSQVIIRQIAFSDDPQLEAEIIALATGIILGDDMNVTRIGRKHGLTKQAISKRVVRFCEDNGLPPSIFMRPERDRQTYALSNQPRIS